MTKITIDAILCCHDITMTTMVIQIAAKIASVNGPSDVEDINDMYRPHYYLNP